MVEERNSMDKWINCGQEAEVRKGPWTMEEDLTLINYIASHGEGLWNNLACSAGLKRTGKSCRLRWLNYLRPDVRRGNITPEEQLLIMELHALWGNRWSKIARQLPGRTDNEIKNYWRTRIQKKANNGESEDSSTQLSPVVMTYNEATSSHIISCQGEEGKPQLSYFPMHDYSSVNPEAYIQHYNGGDCSVSISSVEDLWSMQFLNGD